MRRSLDRKRRDVLKLECQHVNVFSKLSDGIEIVIRRGDFNVGNLTGGSIRFRRKRVHPVAHLPRGDGKHPAQLTATEDADDGARQDRRQ